MELDDSETDEFDEELDDWLTGKLDDWLTDESALFGCEDTVMSMVMESESVLISMVGGWTDGDVGWTAVCVDWTMEEGCWILESAE